MAENSSIYAYASKLFSGTQEFGTNYYKPLALVIMIAGTVGNSIALITFCFGKSIQTTHFVFYKALTLAELSCNVNHVLEFIFNAAFNADPHGERFIYRNAWAAYAEAIFSRVIYSFAGYLIMYMTLLIAFDRFAAVWMPMNWSRNERRKRHFALTFIVLASFLSLIVHSWAAFCENIVSVHFQNNNLLYAVEKRDIANNTVLQLAFQIKNVYNIGTRLIYVCLLVGLTLGVIIGFIQLERKRNNLLPKIEVIKSDLKQGSSSKIRQRRIERSLFGLMIAVIAVSLIQVLPREAARVLELIYPQQFVVDQAANVSLSESERYFYVNVYIYGHCYLMYAANLATSLDRSVKFYLYVLLNRQVRQETLNVWCSCSKHGRTLQSRTGCNAATQSISYRRVSVINSYNEPTKDCEKEFHEPLTSSLPNASVLQLPVSVRDSASVPKLSDSEKFLKVPTPTRNRMSL